jgi:hypothetical protein
MKATKAFPPLQSYNHGELYMPDLKSLEGQLIVASIPMIDNLKLQKLRLHKVEDAGIWIESSSITSIFLANLGVTMAPKSLVFFLPWHQVHYILSSVDAPSIIDSLAD